jgi:hypothetical protein
MAAKVLYTQKGSDPATIIWPTSGPAAERFTFTSGTPQVIANLIGYGDGSITYHDGRTFPPVTAAGSTFGHQK